MARMPGAIWKPLAADWNKQPRMKAYDIFCLHTMVGSLVGTDGYFKVGNGIGYGGTESHFGVGPDGTIFQWQDTDFQADANWNGNWHIISSENADTGFPFPKWIGSDVPAMTPAQVEANAQIAAWLYRTHGIPVGMIPDSKPGRRGLAVHRWGVPGYVVPGGELWSSSAWKACPGVRRIAQAPQVSARAQQLLGGVSASTVQEDDMPSLEDISDAVWARTPPAIGGPFPGHRLAIIEGHTAAVREQLAGLTAAVGKLAEALASGRDDLTAADLVEAVDEGIRRGGAAVLAAQEVARAATDKPAA